MPEERKNREDKLAFPFTGGKREILLKEIFYIESKAHKLDFVKEGGTLSMYGKLSDIEPKLMGYHFVRCHQSFLVNLEKVEAIKNYWIYLSNGMEIPVSRQKFREVRQQFLQFTRSFCN